MATQTTQISYEVFTNIQDLPKDEQELLEEAREAMQTSYSPYSQFRVGAAVQLKNGDIVTGSNQENASYPQGMCAERNALFAAGSQGKGDQIAKIATIGTGHKEETTHPISSCGGCRQVIAEYQHRSKNPLVLLFSGNTGEIYRFVGAESLLPFAFQPDDLKS